MDVAVLASLGALAVGFGLLALEQHTLASFQSVRLQFGRDVTPEAVLALVDRLAGLHLGARVVLDVDGGHDGISYYLHSDQATLETLRGGLRALIPSLRLERVSPRLRPEQTYNRGRSIRLGGRLRTIRGDAITETSAGLLAALQPLGRDEQVLLRWVVRPSRPFTVPAARAGVNIETEERRRLRQKNVGSVVRARGLIAVRAGHARRADHLLARVNSVLRSRGTAYGWIRTWPRTQGRLRRELSQASFLLMDRYASGELAGLLAWPVDAPVLPGVVLGTSPQLMPSSRLPNHGRVIGMDFPRFFGHLDPPWFWWSPGSGLGRCCC